MEARAAHTITCLSEVPLPATGAALCDLDGCLVSGNHVWPGARDLVERLGARLWIVSNNSCDTADGLARRLAALGLPVPARQLILAGEQALRLVARERPGARVAVHGAAPLQALRAALGLAPGGARPEVVVLARDTSFGLNQIAEVLAAVANGAELVVTNSDGAHPDAEGAPVPETGALLAALRAVRPDLAHTEIGKPGPILLRLALERAGARAEHSVFIGDNPRTDGLAAARFGIPFIHVDRAGALQTGATPC